MFSCNIHNESGHFLVRELQHMVPQRSECLQHGCHLMPAEIKKMFLNIKNTCIGHMIMSVTIELVEKNQ